MEKNKKIFIIDDNVDYSDAIKLILESDQYTVDVANSSLVAQEKLSKELPDLIILDIMMQKGAEGVLLARKFKKDPRLSKIPILMLTSITKQTGFEFHADDPRDDRYLPVDVFIKKPIAPKELLATVRSLLSDQQDEKGSKEDIHR